MFPLPYLLLIVCLLMAPGRWAFSQPPLVEGRKAPEPSQPPRTDLLGDPLPSGAIARLGTSRLCQPSAYRKAFSPDGTRLAAVNVHSNRPVLVLWEVRTGKELWRKQLPVPVTMSFSTPPPAFSPDGKTVALGYPDKTIRLWDTATGRERGRLTGQDGFITGLTFSTDGNVLASVDNKTIRLWDVATGKEQRLIHEERGHLWATAFSADSKTLVAMRSTFRLPNTLIWTASQWDVATGNERPGKTFELVSSYYCPLSPDARYFAVETADYKSIRLLDPMTGKELRRTEGEGNRLSNIVFSADGRSMTAGSGDSIVRVWDVATGKVRHQFKALSGGVMGLVLSRDGGLVALNASEARTCLHIYDVARGKEIHTFPGHRDGPLTVAFARDGRTVITVNGSPAGTWPVEGWADWSFRIWDPATGKELRATEVNPGGRIYLPLISPDARLIAAVLHDGTIHLWDVAAGKELQHWKGPTREYKWGGGKQEWKTAEYTAVLSAAFSPDGKTFLVPAGREGLIKRWDTATGKELPPLKAPLPAGPVFPSPDGRTLLASAHDQKGHPPYSLLLLDAVSGRLLRNMDIIVPATRKSLFPTPINGNAATASADGRTWAVRAWTDGPKVVLFEAATGQKRGLLDPPGRHGISALAFSPDGRWLVVGSDDLSLWDLAAGRIVSHAASPGGLGATSLAFSPDGKRLAVGGNDSSALVYDVAELLKGKVPAPAKLSAGELEGLWKDLTGADAARAYRAIQRLAAVPQSVPFLKDHLKATPGPDLKRLAQLIADLDRDDFEVREKATRELEKLGPQAEPALRRALEGMPSAELRARVGYLLEKLKPETAPSAELIALRALEALEIAGTPEARQVIKGLVDEPADTPLTRAAKAALERLAIRAGSAR